MAQLSQIVLQNFRVVGNTMENQQLDRIRFALLLFGVFIGSFGVLGFEISLTRIFSVILDYHYSFLVVSLALFGLGIGGLFAQAFSSKTPPNENFGKLSIITLLFSLSTSFFVLIAVSFPDMNL